MKNYLICKNCGYTFENIRKSGECYCPQYKEKKHFYLLTFGCGGKPTELYEKINENLLSK